MGHEEHVNGDMAAGIRLRIQALVDNELADKEIGPTLEEIHASPELRREYEELLKLRRRLAAPVPAPPADWLADAERNVARRISRKLGIVLFLGSYVVLLGYGVASMFTDPSVPLTVAILVASTLVGFGVLLGNAIADRVRESRNDKYREIIR